MDSLRIDKWLWAVRIFKTRQQATDACKAGHVKMEGHTVKASREVRPGDVIEAYNGHIRRTVKVKALKEKRMGAALVAEHLEELTPPEEFDRRKEASLKPIRLVRPGKPGKRDRRRLSRIKESW